MAGARSTALAARALACACAGAPAPSGRPPARIVGGSARANAAVVRVAGAGNCAEALVAPDLVLTAKHCVAAVTGGAWACAGAAALLPRGPDAAASSNGTAPDAPPPAVPRRTGRPSEAT